MDYKNAGVDTFLALKDIKMLLLQIAQEPIFHFLQLFLQIILF